MKIPSDDTRTERFKEHTPGPWEWEYADAQPYNLQRKGLYLGDGAFGPRFGHPLVLMKLLRGWPPSHSNERLIAAAPTLLQERDTLLARLEGRAELPEGYGPIATLGSGIHMHVPGWTIPLMLSDTPENRCTLAAMAWAHWHATQGCTSNETD